MSDVCYFCTTPFQLMTIVAIQAEHMFNADILIDPHFERSEYYRKRLEETGLFNEVIVVDASQLNVVRREKKKILRLMKLLNLYVGKFPNTIFKSRKYKMLFTSTNALVYQLACFHYNKVHHKYRTVYFDDGEGTYDDFKKIYKKANKYSERITLFLYAPDLFQRCYPDYRVELIEIKKWTSSSRILEYLDKVFDEGNDVSINEQAIILDTIRGECLSKEEVLELDNIYREIAEVSSYKDIIIKRHPRDKSFEPGFKYYSSHSVPFEFIALKSSIEKKLLISLSSSAVIMPKIILDQEPTILLLYRLFDMKLGESNSREKMYECCKELYRDKERFIIPKSREEIREKVQCFMNS